MKLVKLSFVVACSLGLTAMVTNSEAENNGTRKNNSVKKILPYNSVKFQPPKLREPGIVVMFQFNGVHLLNITATEIEQLTYYPVFPMGTLLSIKTRENIENIKTIRYQMDAAPDQPYFESLRLLAKGDHRITFIEIDSLGAEHPLSPIKFKIVE